MDRGAWRATAHRVTNSRDMTEQLNMHTHTYNIPCILLSLFIVLYPNWSVNSKKKGILLFLLRDESPRPTRVPGM